jgi:class 3 adenylate cyclase
MTERLPFLRVFQQLSRWGLWREIVASYHRAATGAITHFGGHVAQYLGDGVMTNFGWPAAHENDAERAARAGLAILESISRLNEKPVHAKLAARVGIHSGAVVGCARARGKL